jgi:nucleoside diphosphate kinase
VAHPDISSEESWTDHVFSILAPDCVRRQLIEDALDKFAGMGLSVAGWRTQLVTPLQNDTIAALQGAGAGSTYRYRAIDALFDLGPAMILRLRDEKSRPAAELYEQAMKLKGGAHYTDWQPGTIRHDLGGINTVMSLVHVSDTPVNAAREATVALGADGAAGLLPGEALGAALPVLNAGRQPETRGHREVLTGVRSRVLAQLWGHLSDQGRSLVADANRRSALAEAPIGELIARELSSAGTRHPLAAVLRASFDPSQPPVDIQYVADLLALHGIGLDDWEFAVLATSMHFAPAR